MAGGIAVRFHPIAGTRHHVATGGVNDNGAHGYLAAGRCCFGFRDRHLHISIIGSGIAHGPTVPRAGSNCNDAVAGRKVPP